MDFNEYINRGMSFFQEKKFGPAIENFEAALKIQPGNADLRQMIEMLKTQADNNSKFAQACESEAKHRANIMGQLFGVKLEKITDVDKIIAEYTQTLKLNPNDASAKSILASAHYIRGLMSESKEEYARAVGEYSAAIKNEPDYPLAFKNRGRANLKIGNYDQAIKDFEKTIQFNPDDPKPRQDLAGAYMERGIAHDQKRDYARAAADFEMVLKFDPNDNSARELLEMAKVEMQKK